MRRTQTIAVVLLLLCVPLVVGVCFAQNAGPGPNEMRAEVPDASIVSNERPEQETPTEPEFEPFDDPTIEARAYSWDQPRPSVGVGQCMATRGTLTTDTLMTIQECPDKVHYGETFSVAGVLHEDNNSDGNPGAGDLPIPMALMRYTWDPGSPFIQEDYFSTDQDDPDNGFNPGEWNFTIDVDEPRLGECELEIMFKGQWTMDGSVHYELNDTELNADTLINNQQLNFDDDGDMQVDEEALDGIDNDGDLLIDEDTFAFVSRQPCSKKMYIDLWHETAISAATDKSILPIGETITISGSVADASVVTPDTQNPESGEPAMAMGYKMIRVFFDGQYVGEVKATQKPGEMVSRFTFPYTIPMGTSAGKHILEARFDPTYNTTLNNYYEPVKINRTIKVQRYTDVIFDDVGVDAWVYHGKRIQINGSIVDSYMYSLDKVRQGPSLVIGSEDFHARYKYYVHWGKPTDAFYKRYGPFFVNNTNGSFNINIEVSASNIQDLGPTSVSVEFFVTEGYWQIGTTDKLDQGRYFYYRPVTNETTYVVRAHTALELYLDQNNNGIYNEPGEYITRVPYEDNQGKTHYFNIARVRGILKDVEASSAENPVPVANHDIVFYWGYGDVAVREFITTTDTQGRFSFDVPIKMDQALGPVTVLAKYTNKDPSQEFYDSSAYFDASGDPFSVVAMTHAEVEVPMGSVYKGESVYIKGSLSDDMGTGMKNKTVTLYWLSHPGENLGTPIGMADTDSLGRFTFTEYEVPITQPVGTAYVVAKYKGSPEYPNGPQGKKYAPKDAYAPSLSIEQPYDVSAYTMLTLDPLAGTMVRNQEFSVTGSLSETYKGERTVEAVKRVDVDIYLDNAGETYRIGSTTTSGDGLTDGHFIFSGKVPKDLYIGDVKVRAEFNGTSRYAGSGNSTMTELWANTYIRMIVKPSADEKGRLIIEEETITPETELIFNLKVFERDTPDNEEPRAVQYGVVWLNISTASGKSFHNTSVAYTNEYGRVMFNYSKPWKDSDFGLKLAADRETELIINVTYVGGENLKGSHQTYSAAYKPTPPPPRDPWYIHKVFNIMVWQWILILIVLMIIASIVIFFTYRYYRKRARIRGMKKIIRRAADQLVAGNEYTAVIFKSYQKLGAHLRKYGYLRRDSETFREFEDAIRLALPIDHESMDNFLELLEEARYSQHKIGAEQRNAAIDNLRNIESSLEKIILDEDAAMKALESVSEDFTETEVVIAERTGVEKP